MTRFWFFGRYQLGSWGVPERTFELAVVVRDLVLVGCLIAWYLREADPSPVIAPEATVEAEAAA